MVKPPLRRKSIGFKVSEEEYAQLEKAARAGGCTLGEWCREVVLARASDAERRDPALAEIVGVPLAAGERVAALWRQARSWRRKAFDKLLDPENQRSEARTRRPVAAAGERETEARKTQRREAVIPFFSTGSVPSAGAASRVCAALRE